MRHVLFQVQHTIPNNYGREQRKLLDLRDFAKKKASFILKGNHTVMVGVTCNNKADSVSSRDGISVIFN